MKKIVILLGPPGSGKGTVGAALAQKWGLPLISSGDLLRQNVKAGSELGKKVQEFMERGQLVPDSLVLEVVAERMKKDDARRGFILDGFPRNLNQAMVLSKLLEKEKYRVIYLKASDDFLVERLSNRRVCLFCGRVYHLINIPPRFPGVCDGCAGRLEQRQDDKTEVIRQRLDVYRNETAPLLDYYNKTDSFLEISGEGKLEETLSLIEKRYGISKDL